MPVSAYARKIMMDGAIIYHDTTLFSSYVNALNKIGTNVNQIAHNSNALGTTIHADVQQLKTEFERLKKLYIELYSSLL
jgi:cell division ATPase FtsA